MKYTVKAFCLPLLVILQMLSAKQTQANHIIGADLSYSHITGQTYNIKLVVYGDCNVSDTSLSGYLKRAAPLIKILDNATSVATFTLDVDALQSGREISRICPWDSTSCSSPSGIAPGIKKYVYTKNYTFPSISANWKIVFDGSLGGGYLTGRSVGLTNIFNNSVVSIQATLNNNYSNSSPVLATDQPQYFCLYRDDTYVPAATDADGDSLYFELVPAIDAALNATANYYSPYSGTNPILATSTGSTIDHATGNLYFHPGNWERDLVVYKISEYRSSTLVGTSQREMTVLTVYCSPNNCDTVTSIKNIANNTLADKINIYPNPNFGEFTLLLPAHTATAFITVESTVGKVIYSKTVANHLQTDIPIVLSPSLPTGTYFVKVTIGDKTYREKLLIR